MTINERFQPIVVVQIVQSKNISLPVYSYYWADSELPQIGDLVIVPFGKANRGHLAVVLWSNTINFDNLAKCKFKEFEDYAQHIRLLESKITLKTVQKSLRPWKLCQPLMSFAKRFSDYNLIALGHVFKLILPFMDIWQPAASALLWRISDPMFDPSVLTAKQQLVWQYLSQNPPMPTAAITKACTVTVDVINRMHKKGLLSLVEAPRKSNSTAPDLHNSGEPLSQPQQKIHDTIVANFTATPARVQVLYGLPGTGKTAIYRRLMQRYLKNHKQILLLLPEIVSAKALYQQLRACFGDYAHLWHSKVSHGQKKHIWQKANRGDTMIVMGTRSSLFVPFSNLGLVVVDEEHDSSYKQEDGNCCYQARDMAVWRARLEHIPVLLVSTTPSLETMHNVQQQKYDYVKLLPGFYGSQLPQVSLIDMRQEKLKRQQRVSDTLCGAITKCLRAGNQTLLFFNRRGYAPCVSCRQCHYRFSCEHCSSHLVLYKLNQNVEQLKCHYCDFARPLDHCPQCRADKFYFKGVGVERIHEEIQSKFPRAKVLVVSSDSVGSDSDMQQVMTDIADRKYDIIIGTQILAKGYHFPRLALVGLLNVDAGLRGVELRALEQNFQLIFQLTNRFGSTDKPRKVFMQTFSPEDDLIQHVSTLNQEAFYRDELANRKRTFMPPFARLALLTLISSCEKDLDAAVHQAFVTQPECEGMDILGPSAPYIAKINDAHRQNFLCRARKDILLQEHLRAWRKKLKLPRSVFCKINIDPYNILT